MDKAEIEAVARAICDAAGEDPDISWREYRDQAVAAIKAKQKYDAEQ